MARSTTATAALRATPANGAALEDDGPERRSASELAPGPALIAALLDVLTATKLDGGQDAVAVSTANGEGALLANGRAAPVALVVAGHTAGPARQAGTHATGRAVGKEATAGPRRVEDASAGLPGRRRVAADGSGARRPSAAVARVRVGSALPARVAAAARSSAVALSTVPMAVLASHQTTAAAGPMATNAVAEEGQLLAVPDVTVAEHRTGGIPANEAVGDDVGLGGLDVGPRTTFGQLRLRLQPQRRIAAGIDPRVRAPSNTFPRSAVGAPSSADDEPRVDGQEAVGPRSTVT